MNQFQIQSLQQTQPLPTHVSNPTPMNSIIPNSIHTRSLLGSSRNNPYTSITGNLGKMISNYFRDPPKSNFIQGPNYQQNPYNADTPSSQNEVNNEIEIAHEANPVDEVNFAVSDTGSIVHTGIPPVADSLPSMTNALPSVPEIALPAAASMTEDLVNAEDPIADLINTGSDAAVIASAFKSNASAAAAGSLPGIGNEINARNLAVTGSQQASNMQIGNAIGSVFGPLGKLAGTAIGAALPTNAGQSIGDSSGITPSLTSSEVNF